MLEMSSSRSNSLRGPSIKRIYKGDVPSPPPRLGDGMRKYRGLDEQGVEMENAYCHPECDVCPQCGERLEESGENLCTRFTRKR